VVYRKGELSKNRINREWPHQVALPQLEAREQYDRHELIVELCRGRSHAPRGHSVVHEGRWWNVHCFADPADAAWFLERFDGVAFDPRDRGTGRSWSSWHPGRARERDAARGSR
jgi:hypothetical protein